MAPTFEASVRPERTRRGQNRSIRRSQATSEGETRACSENVTAARAASARNQRCASSVVVVGQFFTSVNPARSADPDRVPVDVHVAVRLARVIDVARDVAAHRGIAHPPPVDVENPDAVARQIPGFTPTTFSLRDELTLVLDDASIRSNRLIRIDAPAGDRRAAA